MSEQSLPVVDHEVPKFSELDAADWGRDAVPAQTDAAETASTTSEDGTRETSSEQVTEVDADAETATKRGWVPKEQWRGPEERWVDARAFNERYESVLPVVQKENAKLASELRAQQAELAELRRQAQEWQKSQQDQERARAQLRLDTLKMERKTAIENQDWDTVVRVDDELLDLKVTEKTAPKPSAPPQDPEVKRILLNFAQENPIFDKDEEMAQVLAEQVTVMRASGSPLKGRELLDKAKERVQRMYPERFGAIPRRQHAMAETGGSPSGGRSTVGKQWNDLKPEYREANDRFIKTTPGITRDDIVKNAPPEAFR